LCLWQVCIDADLPWWLTREEGKAERHPRNVDAVPVVRRGVGRVVNPTVALRGQWRNCIRAEDQPV